MHVPQHILPAHFLLDTIIYIYLYLLIHLPKGLDH